MRLHFKGESSSPKFWQGLLIKRRGWGGGGGGGGAQRDLELFGETEGKMGEVNISGWDWYPGGHYGQRIPGYSCARNESVDIAIIVTSRNGDRKIMPYSRITSRPTTRIRLNKLATFQWWAKGSREAASEGPAVLHIRFCGLSSNSKQQLRAPTKSWKKFFMHGCMVDL